MHSVEQNTKLLRLHLQWPDRGKFGEDPDEGLAFFKWLFMNHSHRPEVLTLETIDDVDDFLEINRRILRPQPAAGSEATRLTNLRREPRIANNVSVILTVRESADDAARTGAIATGRSVDLGLHGMRLIVDRDLPTGSMLDLNIEPDRDDALKLQGILGWTTPHNDHYLMGIRVVEDNGFELWRAQFGARFVAPNLPPPPMSRRDVRPASKTENQETRH